MPQGCELRGLERLLERLEALYGGALAAAMQRPVEDALFAMREEAVLRCPKASGELAGSIGVRLRTEGETVTGEVFAASPHAAPVEMGTASSPAQPFMYPAMKLHQADAINAAARALARHMREGGTG